MQQSLCLLGGVAIAQERDLIVCPHHFMAHTDRA
jgi:hypothetical protein